jgi:hyaluronan synthase
LPAPTNVPTSQVSSLSDFVARSLVAVGLGLLMYFSMVNQVFRPVLEAAEAHAWGRLATRPGVLWGAMGTLMLLVRTILWFRYRPEDPVTMDRAPSLTVIIPAFNEGAMVGQAIDSVALARYPAEKLEIFVVDDGSTDDTWVHIEAAVKRHGDRVTAVRFPQNQGKRAALAEGFRRARGEVIATIDSDSVIERDTLLNLMGPFRNPRIGAVAGKVLVLNRQQGMIPRMLHVRFVLSFDLLRAVQSTYGTVLCCPGALSAYRTSVVRDVLDTWMSQTFMGVPCTYGEDRAMTNLIFEKGFDSAYQGSALVWTVVPTTYSKLCKMFLRWDRSFIREETRFARLVLKRPPRSRLLALLEMVVTDLRYPVSYFALVMLCILVWQRPLILVRVLVAIGAMALLNMVYYFQSERSADLLYGVLYAYFAFFGLFWIFPYALVTLRTRGWLTR